MSAIEPQTLQIHHADQFAIVINVDVPELNVLRHGLFQCLYIPALKVVVHWQKLPPF